MTYHHTPGHPVADIYAKHLARKELWRTVGDTVRAQAAAMRKLSTSWGFFPRPDQSVHTEEHPIEAEEGWLGGTDSDSDDPGGWAR